MKKILIISILLTSVFVLRGQDSTYFWDLPAAVVINNSDQFYMVQGTEGSDSTVRVTILLLLQGVSASIDSVQDDVDDNGVNISSNAVAIGSNTSAIGLNTTHRGLTNNPHSVTLEQLLSATGQSGKGIISNGTTWEVSEIEGGGATDSAFAATNIGHIQEYIAGEGVLIDALLRVKDGHMELAGISTPSAPSAGYGRLFMDTSDGKLKFRTSSTTYDLTAGTVNLDSTYQTVRTDSVYSLNGAGLYVEGVAIEDSAINFPTAGNNGVFWGGNTGLYEGGGTDNLKWKFGGIDRWVMTSTTLQPVNASTNQLGTNLSPLLYAYIDTLFGGSGVKLYADGINQWVLEDQISGAQTLADLLAGGGGGTVLSVAAGNGMDFSTITSSGSVTMGTPSTLTPSTTNSVTSTSHTHSLNLSSWTGNTSITSVGTIGTGTWNGEAISDGYVANDITLTNIAQITNRAATNLTGNNWRLLYVNGSGSVTELSLGTSGQYLMSNGASSAPSWGTPTGGGGSSDTIQLDTLAHMLIDTLTAVGRIGLGNTGDTASMQIGGTLLEFPTIQDSVVYDSCYAYCVGSSGDITLRAYELDGPNDASKTYLHEAINPTTGTPAGTSSFSVKASGPGKIIKCDITAVGAPPVKVVYYLFYHEKRAF